MVGDAQVASVVDTIGVLGPYPELFPNAPGDAWGPWRERHSNLFDGDSWRLPFRSFVVRGRGATVLVDTGVGPAGGGDWMPDREGRLLDGLARVDVAPDAVDVVFISHIHVDHVGWTHAFPRARILLHRLGWELANARGERDFIRRNLLELAGRVETVEGEAEIATGVIAFETPGHSPGHMSLRVGDELVLLADVAPHPAQLSEPSFVFAFDDEPDVAVQTRREVLAAYGDRILACPHFPGAGFGRIDGGVWAPLT